MVGAAPVAAGVHAVVVVGGHDGDARGVADADGGGRVAGVVVGVEAEGGHRHPHDGGAFLEDGFDDLVGGVQAGDVLVAVGGRLPGE